MENESKIKIKIAGVWFRRRYLMWAGYLVAEVMHVHPETGELCEGHLEPTNQVLGRGFTRYLAARSAARGVARILRAEMLAAHSDRAREASEALGG